MKIETAEERSAIEKLIFSYSSAFNAAETSKAAALYTHDGILMPNNAPLAQGQEQLKATFEFLFKSFEINIQYIIDELMPLSAYRFRNNGTIV